MKEIVWIVSWYDWGEYPVVIPFNNKEAAQKYYEYESRNDHEKVDIDECEVHSTADIS